MGILIIAGIGGVYSKYVGVGGSLSSDIGSSSYSKNPRFVYDPGHMIIPVANPATFEILHEEKNASGLDLLSYTKDDTHVFYHGLNYRGTAILALADPASFEIFFDSKNNATGYAKDSLHVYYQSAVLPKSDLISFNPVFTPEGNRTSFGKDTTRVYYANDILPKADPATFTVLIEPSGAATLYAKDKQRVYYKNFIVSDADPVSFVALEVPENSYEYIREAQDKNNSYYHGMIFSQ